MTPKLRALVDALDAELREVSRDPDADLSAVEMSVRVWLSDIEDVRKAQLLRAEGRCRCGRRLEASGQCRSGCIQAGG